MNAEHPRLRDAIAWARSLVDCLGTRPAHAARTACHRFGLVGDIRRVHDAIDAMGPPPRAWRHGSLRRPAARPRGRLVAARQAAA